MKIKGINLHTPIDTIYIEGTNAEASKEEWNVIVDLWKDILNKGKDFTFGVDGRYYILPEQVLRNSIVSVDYDGDIPE